MRRRIVLAATAGTVLAAGRPAQAARPDRQIRLIVPYGAGNVTDTVARLLADGLSRRLGHSVVVENVPGAGGAIGVTNLARAPADGNTLVLAAMAALAVQPHLTPGGTGYDSLRDVTPVAAVAVPHAFLAVHRDLPARDLEGFVRHARANRVFYGSAGIGTLAHLNMEALGRALRFEAEHVPYRTSAANLTDLLAGRVQATLEPVSITAEGVRSGALRALVYTGSARMPAFPDIPTLAEVAPAATVSSPWLAVFGPRELPSSVVERLASEIRAVVDTPAFRGVLPPGTEALGDGPEALAGRLKADHARFGALVSELGLRGG
ncbi:Bug family tripartite tricarboxylate transporter substrate binding protein [Sabulicella glaciei]|uniref:Tripartite tricarboxylate transporter substrate binding protein n=1 Tax=Sabulicella glaciei TaxID=2984948 RepID=A0ABT3NZI1_9PROT|nr:tripartite tricarboxylate transporter substrate binding protein [Roseococcus sp. MDT2-1-1]MCW8087566.1 tripartite tricarboxylate transporter substrate binding protein [Roseococcus sp. MDT2-1-1]